MSASVCLSGNSCNKPAAHTQTHKHVSVSAAHTILAAYYCVCLCSDKQEGKAISHWGAIKRSLIVSFIFPVLLNPALLLGFTRKPSGAEHSARYKYIIICCSKWSYISRCKCLRENLRSGQLVAGYTVTSVEFQLPRLHRILMNFLWLAVEVDGCVDTVYSHVLTQQRWHQRVNACM